MWYDRGRIRVLVTEDRELIAKPEETLTLDLAQYLFDNGVTALYRPRYGHHEPDLLASPSLLVEAKAYKNSSKTRNYLKNGVYQIHAYLNNLSSKYPIEEAHYVIFRLGGPFYRIDQEISFNPFILYTTVIDIGESSDSGSKQSRPITIPTDEIIEGLEA